MIDITRALPILRAAESPDETAPLKAFSEADALVSRSLNEAYTIGYVVEEAGALASVRWRDLGADLDELHAAALANLRKLAAAHLKLVPRGTFFEVALDGRVDASLVLVDDLWDGSGIIARAIASPIVVALPASEALFAASATQPEGVKHLGSLGGRMLFTRRTGAWDPYG